MDLTTQYCGLTLKNPFMPGASPMARHLDRVRRLEDAGASAIVMHSLFEEQIVSEQVHSHHATAEPAESFPEALSYLPDTDAFRHGPDEYLTQLAKVKAAVDIPVFASLNGNSITGWVDYAQQVEEAGADALEINAYEVTFGAHATTELIEHRMVQLVEHVRQATALPLAVKLLPFFAGLPPLCTKLHDAGAKAVVFFNRTYQPHIDVEELEMSGTYPISEPGELATRLRWLGLVSSATPIDLACSGGVHRLEDAIRAIMCGASVVQVVSLLLQRGEDRLRDLCSGLSDWLDEHGYDSLEELRGSMDHTRCPDPWAYTRSTYIRALHNYPV